EHDHGVVVAAARERGRAEADVHVSGDAARALHVRGNARRRRRLSGDASDGRREREQRVPRDAHATSVAPADGWPSRSQSARARAATVSARRLEISRARSMTSTRQLLEHAHVAFNERDVDAALTLMHPRVNWPNAWEGG